MLPAPSVLAQTNDSLSAEEEGSVADDESSSDQGDGGGPKGLMIDDLAHLDDLHVAWGFDIVSISQERSQQASVAGGPVTEQPRPTISSSDGGKVDNPSVPVGRADSVSCEALTTDTAQGSGVDPPAILSRRRTSFATSVDEPRDIMVMDPGSEPVPRGKPTCLTPVYDKLQDPRRAACGGCALDDDPTFALDRGGRYGFTGWSMRGIQRGVERVHDNYLSCWRRTACPAIRSWRRATDVQSGVV